MFLEHKDLFLLHLLTFFQLVYGYRDNDTSNPVNENIITNIINTHLSLLPNVVNFLNVLDEL